MAHIVFSHGNSFPGGSYGVLLDALRARGFKVSAVDRFGHDPGYPVTSNWPQLVQQLADFTAHEVARHGEPALLVGHSLGGMLSVMTAALHPHLTSGVLMLDSPLVSGWRANAVDMAKRTQLVGSVSPGKVSRRRRNRWSDDAAALAYFKSKTAFARWHPDVLRDYLVHGLQDDNGERCLRFDRDVETHIYNTLPHNVGALLRRHPLRCPAAFIGGLSSLEMRQVGMALTLRVTAGRITMLDGTHLFPMERPYVTAAAAEAALLNLEATSHVIRSNGASE